MDILQFIASIVSSLVALAWPAAFAFAVWLFREKIDELLPHFHVKHSDWEASFRLDQAEKEAQDLPPVPDDPAALPTPEEEERFSQLAKLSPRSAIIELRIGVERALGDLMERRDHSAAGKKHSILAMTRLLRSDGVIDHPTSAMIDDLRVVGNTAVHERSGGLMSERDALRYRKLANEIIGRLNAI